MKSEAVPMLGRGVWVAPFTYGAQTVMFALDANSRVIAQSVFTPETEHAVTVALRTILDTVTVRAAA